MQVLESILNAQEMYVIKEGQVGLRESCAPHGGGDVRGCPGQWAQPQAAGAQGALRHLSQTCSLALDGTNSFTQKL